MVPRQTEPTSWFLLDDYLEGCDKTWILLIVLAKKIGFKESDTVRGGHL